MKNLRRLLVANRGEIARRIFRSAHDMGISTVAVYADPDRTAPFVAEADDAVRIGPADLSESYLSTERTLDVRRRRHGDTRVGLPSIQAASLPPRLTLVAHDLGHKHAIFSLVIPHDAPPPG